MRTEENSIEYIVYKYIGRNSVERIAFSVELGKRKSEARRQNSGVRINSYRL